MIDASPGSGDVPSSAPVPLIGDHIEVFWPHDDQYYRGVVSATTSAGEHIINYDDGDVETLTLANETWRPCDSLTANATGFAGLSSDTACVVKEIFNVFGNKPFMFHQAQAFPSYVLLKAYEAEESVFKQHVKCVSVSDVPQCANVISSHTV